MRHPFRDEHDIQRNTEDPRHTTPAANAVHTPGPWRCMPFNRYAVTSEAGPIADVVGLWGDDTHPAAEANARLIAAAPDLLADGSLLLRTVWDTMRHREQEAQWEVLEEVGKRFAATIARAEGRERA